MTKWILSACVGGVIAYGWLAISWMALPFHLKALQPLNHEADVAAVLDFATGASGVYVYPNPGALTAPAGGIAAFIALSKTGTRPQAYSMALGVFTCLLGAFLAAWMLSKTQGLSYRQKVLFMTAFGLAAGWLGHMPSFNWWHVPAGYTLLEIADSIIAWTMAGAAMGKLQ